MATISTRLDESLKSSAEEIADSIGIPLSTAINIFLKKFIAVRGFPFEVIAPTTKTNKMIDETLLDQAFKRAVANPNAFEGPNHFTYLDPNTNQLITIQKKKE